MSLSWKRRKGSQWKAWQMMGSHSAVIGLLCVFGLAGMADGLATELCSLSLDVQGQEYRFRSRNVEVLSGVKGFASVSYGWCETR